MQNKKQDWQQHLEDLEKHYHPDKFFSDQENIPTNESNVREHFFAPALTEETDIPEEAQLSIDIYQDEDHLYVVTPIAGINPKSLDISLDKDILTIRGERNKEFSADPKSYIYQECYWGKFSRSVILPLPVKATKVEANFKEGVLKITLPKEEESRKVEIKVKASD
ncbi:Hsp20/alpha crystallin family protein [Candidatus Kuenenbacteria bacterium]|nr:Hsp20/alpha crystallin family protein [Candidatus Kuenenbacteria bacterium]